MNADKLQRLPIFGVFIAGMMNKSLNDCAVVIVSAIRAGNMPFGQTAFLYLAFRPA